MPKFLFVLKIYFCNVSASFSLTRGKSFIPLNIKRNIFLSFSVYLKIFFHKNPGPKKKLSTGSYISCSFDKLRFLAPPFYFAIPLKELPLISVFLYFTIAVAVSNWKEKKWVFFANLITTKNMLFSFILLLQITMLMFLVFIRQS